MKKIQKALAFVSIFSMLIVAGGCGSAKVGSTKPISTGNMNTKAIDAKDEKKVAAEREKTDAAIETELQQKNKDVIDMYTNVNPQNIKNNIEKLNGMMLADANKSAYTKEIQACINANTTQKETTVSLQSNNSQPLPDDLSKKYNKQGYVAYIYVYQVGWRTSDGKTGTDIMTLEWIVKDNDVQLLNFADKNN